MGYDTKCYDLAAAFLADTPDIDNERSRAVLAQRIQDTIEGETLYLEGACERCGEARGKDVHDHCEAKSGGPTEHDPQRPHCKSDQSCCDFVCGN